MNAPQKTIEELRAEVNQVLMSLTPREAEALRMRYSKRRPDKDEEESDIRTLLQQLVALKNKKKS